MHYLKIQGVNREPDTVNRAPIVKIMKNVRLLLSILALLFTTVVIGQERPQVESTEEDHLAKAKIEVDSLDNQKAFWLMTKSQRRSYERSKRKKVRHVEKGLKAKERKKAKVAMAKGTSKERRVADQKYQDLGYAVSADEYNRLDGREKTDQWVIANLANSYRLNNKTLEAEYWYGRIINYTDDPEHKLRYAQMLQINGKCEDAVRWFKAYAKDTRLKIKRNREVIQDCDELDEIVTHENVELYNVEALNTGHLDFSPIPYQDGLVFTSTRGNRASANRDSWTKDNFSDLFYAVRNSDGSFKDPVPLNGDINAKFHDGVATFSAGERVMIFTRNNYKGISNKGLIDLKVFEAVRDDNYWADAVELPFNSDEFTSCHPTVSLDGQRLYFASNRPGGYGGLDIYVSENEGGNWGEPINLGPEVNSEGNELFPFIGDDETLYYSSNGWRGLGGLDLFKVVKAQKNNESTWGRRENLGIPFNSLKDDFGFYINRQKNLGYISSNREGGHGGDDIYSWQMKKGSIEDTEAMASTRKLCVRDEKAGLRLVRAAVSIHPVQEEMEEVQDENFQLTLEPVDESKEKYVLGITKPKSKKTTASKAGGDYLTDGEGLVKYKVLADRDYRVRVNYEGYESKEMIVNGRDWMKQNEFCVSMIKEKCLTIYGTVKERNTDAILPSTFVKLFNKRTGETSEIVTDASGRYSVCVPCGSEYRVSAEKDGYDSGYEFAISNSADCSDKEKVEALVKMYKRQVAVVSNDTPIGVDQSAIDPVYTAPATPYIQPQYQYAPQMVPMTCPPCYQQQMMTYVPVNPSSVNQHFLGNANAQFSVGQVINLKNIYYDFDKDFIRGDAGVELDHVVNLLRTYPSMEIDLGSHTDARGSTEYNRDLSQRRANEAVNYIISKGIQAHRVTARGYGESQLTNQCVDNVNCQDWEHQANRRTEIRIRKFNAPNTTIAR